MILRLPIAATAAVLHFSLNLNAAAGPSSSTAPITPDVPSQPELGGYQLGVAMDIFRGRYRDSFEHPSPIPADKVQRYRLDLPPTHHLFLRGHRVMVQIQSTWFPLYDRNPQTYVANIFNAKPADYQKRCSASTKPAHRKAPSNYRSAISHEPMHRRGDFSHLSFL